VSAIIAQKCLLLYSPPEPAVLDCTAMADRAKVVQIAWMAAALNHLRELEVQTRAIILTLEAERDRVKSGQSETQSVPVRH
jgi:hypothetical protein